MRVTREKHMQILDMLPAAAIPKHLENVRIEAAVCVQSAWRGFLQRRTFADKKSLIIQTRAAIRIQRVVRTGSFQEIAPSKIHPGSKYTHA